MNMSERVLSVALKQWTKDRNKLIEITEKSIIKVNKFRNELLCKMKFLRTKPCWGIWFPLENMMRDSREYIG